MAKQLRRLLISFGTIVLCIALMAGATYAWLTDTVTIQNHLVAGNLDITLERTHLRWSRLGATGSMETGESNEVVDFSEPTDRNLFDLTDGMLIVPGTTYEATLRVDNNRAVTFAYWIEVRQLDKEAPQGEDLIEQLQVTVTTRSGNTVTGSVKNVIDNGIMVGSEDNPVGTLATTTAAETFTVKVEFLDTADNNDAMAEKASFDVVVHAVQVVKD